MADIRNTFTPPGSWRSWGGNPPTSALSADGLVYYGMNVKDAAGALYYIVWSVDPSGGIFERFRLGPSVGQGALAVDHGWLILTIYRQAGDGQTADRHAIPGWKPWTDDLTEADRAWVKAVRAVP